MGRPERTKPGLHEKKQLSFGRAAKQEPCAIPFGGMKIGGHVRAIIVVVVPIDIVVPIVPGLVVCIVVIGRVVAIDVIIVVGGLVVAIVC